MMYRSLYLVQQLKSIKAYFSTEPGKRVVQVFSLCLVMIFGTFCTPKSSSVAKLAASPTALLSSPAITETLIPTATAERSNSVPVLAYYYIWFDTRSWGRAKTDYPVLGHYSSDNVEVMRQHVQWAKNAGIDGFIVSWKGTEKLNRRLEQLVEVAEEENFKLAIIYEGLNFLREPLPLDQVDADMSYFVERYREHSVFDLFEKPVVIWSGTWKF